MVVGGDHEREGICGSRKSRSSFAFSHAATSAQIVSRHGPRETTNVILQKAILVFQFVVITLDLVYFFGQCG